MLPPPKRPPCGSFKVGHFLPPAEVAPPAREVELGEAVAFEDRLAAREHVPRHYPVAHEVAAFPVEEPEFEIDFTEEGGGAARPPVGAVATVRPSVGRATEPLPKLEELLASTAEDLTLVNEPDGGVAFEIIIRDEVFSELVCRVAVRDHRVTAIFKVGDMNLRRLLEAETGRLRASLSERGLMVDEIEVCSD